MRRFVVFLLALCFLPALTGPAAAGTGVKNVIIMIGDGMGYNHVLAADYYQHGTSGAQAYESFPFRFAMSTYPGSTANEPGGVSDGAYDPTAAWASFDYVTKKPTDSAAAATAMATGKKTYNAAVGVDIGGSPVTNLLEAAERAGKSTGVVTTVQFSHATPASFVAHNRKRDSYEEIAQEMINRSETDVIMGAGHPLFDNDGKARPAPGDYRFAGGQATWDALAAGTAGGNNPWKLIQTREEFRALGSGPTPVRVCGVAQVFGTTQQNRSGDASAAPYIVPRTETVPTLAEMTNGALNVLDEDKDGFCLMIEGGAIDWAAHANQSGRLVEEMIDFNAAVSSVVDWVEKNSNWDETLLIVTGDHETGYLTGPGSDPTWNAVVNKGKGILPGMEFHSGGHTNSLLPFFARGEAGKSFKNRIKGHDPVRGDHIDNTDIANVIFGLLE